MKHLKPYKIFEDISDNIEDVKVLLSTLNDEEFNVDVKSKKAFLDSGAISKVLEVSITKKRKSGRLVLKSIFDKEDRLEINTLINQVLSIGDYQLHGDIEYQQKKSSLSYSGTPSTGKTVLKGEVEDIDINELMKNIPSHVEFLVKGRNLPYYRVPEKRDFSTTKWFVDIVESGENKPVNYPKLSGLRKMTFFERDNDTDYYMFIYQRVGGRTSFGRYSFEYVLIPKEKVEEYVIPSIFKVKFYLVPNY
jgi:hypothetical protein